MEAAGGDWLCGDAACGNVNFARRGACNRCGRRRQGPAAPACPEIGKCAADKSRGLFSADDWQCGKCANVNWARRVSCNVCSAPKFAEVEARTGYGGGYNERGIVEYRSKRDSDDDDYDEFGRVKKRKRRDSNTRSKVCGNRRHLGRPSDSSDTPPPRLSRRPTVEAVRRDSSDFYVQNAVPSPRKKRRSSTLSAERPGQIRDPVVDGAGPTARQKVKAAVRDLDSKRRSAHPDYPDDAPKYPEYQRNCSTEDGVPSINKVKYYRFKGKSVDDSFEVVYTLEERIKAAAFAIVYNNCRKSAEEFEESCDKPAPDVKTIFAWRQRLLCDGCLVDGHAPIDTPAREKTDSHKRKRRRRHFASAPKIVPETSDDEFPNRSVLNVTGRMSKDASERATTLGSDAVVESLRTKSCEDKSEDDSNSENKQLFNDNNNTNGSVGRSSTSGAKHSIPDDNKRSDCYMTDNARSETPEITSVRVELARLKSPVRVMTPETQFHEDNFFENNTKSAKKINTFLIPDVPKQYKKIPEDASKSMLEDIISESERYSSGDGGGFDSDIEIDNCVVSKKNNVAVESPPRKSPTKKISPKSTNNVKNLEIIDLPLPKFGQFSAKAKTSSVETSHSHINGAENENNGKNFSSAMKLIYESMSNQPEQRDVNIEYIPTKIHPAMAKRNHQLFESNLMVESIHDIWPKISSALSGTSPNKNVDTIPEPIDKTINNKSSVDDYTPDDDILYSSEPINCDFTKENLSVQPEVLNVDSVNENVEKEQSTDLQKIDSLLNFAGINTDELTKMLKQITSLNTSATTNNSLNTSGYLNTTVIENDKNESPSPVNNSTQKEVKKNDNIPFLDDMFFSGTELNSLKNNTISKNGISDINDVDLLLDDSLECSVRKSNDPNIIGGFKSFAIPKPIMLNRLRNLNQQPTKEQDVKDARTRVVKKNKKRKKKRAPEDNGQNNVETKRADANNEDDEEESGDEGDLSKYDLWGSEDEHDKKGDESTADKDKLEAKPADKNSPTKSDQNQRRERSKSPVPNESKRRYSERSGSGSSRRSSSSSSTTTSSIGKLPRNKYDDFILNSEHSRAGSRDSSSAKSRSPVYDRGRERDKIPSRSRDKIKDRSRENRDRDRHTKPRDRDINKSRDKHRERDRDRQRHHYGGAHANHGGYIRGRAR